MTKFIKTGICTNAFDAVQKLFTDHLDPFFSKFDSHKWRQDKLWCEECDLVYKRSLTAVKAIYQKYSGKYAMPGAPRFTSLDEFVQMVTESGVISDQFGEREISPVYALAMMTQKDEIDSDRHMNMVFAEFIDAIGRVADRINIPHYLEEISEENDQPIITSRITPPKSLAWKIEAYII